MSHRRQTLDFNRSKGRVSRGALGSTGGPSDGTHTHACKQENHLCKFLCMQLCNLAPKTSLLLFY